MYLWRKDSGFFFQMRIPAGHVVNLGATPFRIWLGALKKREAQRRATVLAAAAVEGINAGMDRETLTRSLKALAPKIDALGREEFSVWLVTAGIPGSSGRSPKRATATLTRSTSPPIVKRLREVRPGYQVLNHRMPPRFQMKDLFRYREDHRS